MKKLAMKKLNPYIFIIVILIISFIVMFIIIPYYMDSIYYEREVISTQENNWVDERMKFHGTEMAYRENGVWWFKNKKGERCRL